MCSGHSSVYTVVIYSVQCALYSPHCTLYTFNRALITVQFMFSAVDSFSLQLTVSKVHWSRGNIMAEYAFFVREVEFCTTVQCFVHYKAILVRFVR